MRETTTQPYEIALLNNQRLLPQIVRADITLNAMKAGYLPLGAIGATISLALFVILSPLNLISKKHHEEIMYKSFALLTTISASPGILSAYLASPIYTKISLKDKAFLYTDTQVNATISRLEALAKSNLSTDHALLEKYGEEILERYGTVIFESDENKSLIARLNLYYNSRFIIKSARYIADTLIGYLSKTKIIRDKNNKYEMLENQGKTLFNIIIAVASGSAERAKNGISLELETPY